MPKSKRPRDVNELAKQLVAEATGEAEPDTDPDEGKDPAAVALGRRAAGVADHVWKLEEIAGLVAQLLGEGVARNPVVQSLRS